MAKDQTVAYPAAFIHDAETNTFTIIFPDIPSAISQAETLNKAIINAKEVLKLMLFDETNLPIASSFEKVQTNYPQSPVRIITVSLTTNTPD